MREIKGCYNNDFSLFRKIAFRGKIGRIVGLNKRKATILIKNNLETVDINDLKLAQEEFLEKEKVRVLIDGDFYEGFILKKLPNDYYIVVVNGNQYKTSGEWLDKIKGDLGLMDSRVDSSKAKDEYRTLWYEPNR
ncbi:MAG: hypothetical protein QXY70_00480 [Nanopusillaceae archaeon]